jgi:penicillin amidase
MRLRSLLVASLLLAACSNTNSSDAGPTDAGLHDAGPHDAGPVDAGGLDASTGLESIQLQTTLSAPGLSSPVDVVRDTHGVPHIYGNSLPDVAYAQGYFMAHDRMLEMDFARHEADGTLGYLIGSAQPSVISQDIQMRVNHLRDQAQANYNALESSTDPQDQVLLNGLELYAAGVNAYVTDLNAGMYSLPIDYATIYQASSIQPWTAVDTLLIGELITYELAFDASNKILATQASTEGAAVFDNATDPNLKSRAGFGEDVQVLVPADPTFTINGWTGMNGDTSTAQRGRMPRRVRLHGPGKRGFAPSPKLLEDDLRALAVIDDPNRQRAHGSNNWIISPQLSATGHVLIANDTHLNVDNPATWYINHLVNHGSDAPLNVMGEQFPGAPLVSLGMNQHTAWAATVSFVDITDVYQETVVANCDGDGGACVVFNGQNVPLVPRVESFQIGYAGTVSSTITVTLFDALPQHGPIIPRVLTDANGNVTGLDALGTQELSMKYTGYTAGPIFKAIFGVDRAGSMQEALASLDAYFAYGGFNWLIGDDQGNIGWTEIEQVPRRAPPNQNNPNIPWRVLPGDGTAEWGANMDPRYIPHAYNPDSGFIVTANEDPIGATANNSPWLAQPYVDGGPLYIGAFYDPGPRQGRVTKRLQALIADGGGMSLDDMQSIQADAISEFGQGFAPTLLDAANALLAEEAALADGGASDGGDGGFGPYPQLAQYLAQAGAADGGFPLALIQTAANLVSNWSFDTPSGVPASNPTPQQLSDSQATVVMAYWTSYFLHDTFDDELSQFAPVQPQIPEYQELKLGLFLCQTPLPGFIKTGLDPVTGDSILFDNLTNPTVHYSRQMIAAQALIEALAGIVKVQGSNSSNWAWGTVHTVTLNFLAGASVAPTLDLPVPNDPTFPNGYPRHGENCTVDVGQRGVNEDSYVYEDLGPAIRFVAELDPVNGPTARNTIPGGEIFDPASPHYDDLLQLWLQNQTFDFAYQDSAVLADAALECQTNQLCRVRFSP